MLLYFQLVRFYMRMAHHAIFILNAFTSLLLLQSCTDTAAPPPRREIEVATITLEPRTVPITFEYVGVAQSSHLVEIRARVEGYLDKINYVEGNFVEAGQLLFQLDPKPFEAALEKAKGDLARQKAILWNAERTVDRLQPLFEKNAASRRDLDDAISNRLAGEAGVLSAQAQVREAELNLGYTAITAPIAALSGQSAFREGALISPGKQGLLTTLSVVDPIWVQFSVSESDLLKASAEVASGRLVNPDQMRFKIGVILANGTKFPEIGEVNFADPSFQQNTGTMNVRSIFANPDHILRPGQFVRVQVSGAFRPNAILVPQKAVLQGQDGMFVYVIEHGNQVAMRYVEPGDWYEKEWIIQSGLQPQDQVIVEGTNRVQVGMHVKAIPFVGAL